MTFGQLIRFALDNYGNEVEISSAYEALAGVSRQNDKRPAKMELFVNDDWVLNLKGNPKLADAYLVVRIPRDVVDRAKSPIIAPGEVT